MLDVGEASVLHKDLLMDGLQLSYMPLGQAATGGKFGQLVSCVWGHESKCAAHSFAST